MEDRTFTNSSQVTSGNEPSDLLKQFIDALVEEVVLHGEPFEAQKKWLHKYCDIEHIDSDSLIVSLTEFFDNMEELKSLESKAAVKLAYLQARDCYVSAATVDKLVEGLAKKRTNKAEEAGHNDSADDHDYVDLGLPSGTLWATCNIGATKPEEYGDYFAWGEAEPKDDYDWDTYQYANEDDDEYKLTKYCNRKDDGFNGFIDSLTELQRGDDPASSRGSGWCTPTKTQWDELLEYTTYKWTTRNGVQGCLFTSKKNGETLFLPAAGGRWYNELGDAGSDGYYWSRSLYTDDPYYAWRLSFYSDDCDMDCLDRYNGFSVRPVRQN